MKELTISQLDISDCEKYIKAAKASRKLHSDWVSAPETTEGFTQYLDKFSKENSYSLLAKTEKEELIGCINISEIVRGAFQSAYLGYYAFQPYQGKGLMKKAMIQVINYAFKELKLHRLEANIQPENIKSIALVQSLGFKKEGFSERYLKINSEWKDHNRYAITTEDWKY